MNDNFYDNFYDMLGISKTATVDEIKSAYRKQAMKYHPDRNADNPKEAEKQFKKVKEAYETLSNPQHRQFYDHYGKINPNIKNQSSPMNDFFSGGNNPFDDLINNFFNQHHSHQKVNFGRAPGDDVQFSLNLTLNSVLQGQIVNLQIPTQYPCEVCLGTGNKNKTPLSVCSHCQGLGAIVHHTGFTVMRQTCPHCQGRGKINPNSCPICRGHGHHIINETFQIEIKGKKI